MEERQNPPPYEKRLKRRQREAMAQARLLVCREGEKPTDISDEEVLARLDLARRLKGI